MDTDRDLKEIVERVSKRLRTGVRYSEVEEIGGKGDRKDV